MALCDRDPAEQRRASARRRQSSSLEFKRCARPLLSFARDRDLIPFELGSGGPTYKQASGPSELDEERGDDEALRKHSNDRGTR